MWRSPVWCYVYNHPEVPDSIPVLKQFGLGQTETPEYYNSGKLRTDASHFLIQYTLKGAGHLEYQGELYEVTPGQAFLCNPLDENTAYYYPQHGTEPWHFLFMVFEGGDNIFLDLIDRYGPVFDLPEDLELFEELKPHPLPELHTFLHKQCEPEWVVTRAAQMIGALVNSQEWKDQQKQAGAALANKARTLIQQNSNRRLTVDNLASQLAVTPEHLARAFKKAYGVGPHHFILEARLQRATKLLLGTNLLIKEVATQSGFESARDFNRAFKRFFDISPGEFRQKQNVEV